jgi:hypothetical protein
MGRQFSRELSGGSSGGQDFIDFTPKYVWGGGGGGGGGQKVKNSRDHYLIVIYYLSRLYLVLLYRIQFSLVSSNKTNGYSLHIAYQAVFV